jgi:hypothetical protein
MQGSPSYYAWYEYIGATSPPPVVLNNVTVHAGDHIHILVSYQTSNNHASFYVQDSQTATSQSATVTLGGSYYDGNFAEWIDERPGGNASHSDGLFNLAKYNSNAWFNTEAENDNSNWTKLGNANAHHQIVMYNNGGTELSNPGSIGADNESFTDNWEACADGT